ncbi:MAG: S9 family peptidase [Parabacteroides sp.]|nr:S9 family peptidase [Parabacteroides sp.]
MKKSIGTMLMASSVLLGACCNEQANKDDNASAPLIGRSEVQVKDGLLTPEILYSLARISDARLSPDGKKVLYGVTFISIEQNKGNRELFTVNTDGTGKQQLTRTPKSEQNAVWINGGQQIAFLYDAGGKSQIWIMEADGSNRRQLSNYKGGINAFAFSPDEKSILFVSDIKFGKRTADVYPDLPKATGRIVTDLMYKHWNEWVETVPHPFVAPFDGKTLGQATDLLEGEPYECPMKPNSGIEDLAWSPDSKTIAYACRKKTGMDYALSTNSDIYLYTVATKETRNLTEGMMGYDTYPVFSPDGSKLAWISQERDGYESDKKRLFTLDLASGQKEYLTLDFDYNVDALSWLPDGKSLYFIACKEAVTHIWEIGTADKQIRQITNGQYDYTGFSNAAGNLVAMRCSMVDPVEIYRIDPQSGEATEISFENEAIMSQVERPVVKPRWITTTDNKKMLTWVVYPPRFDETKQYPALLYCQGGPQSTVSQFWSYRWNPALMASNGYIVVAPNRRGLPGFGQEWLEQISGDYGGQNMKDYFSAIDEVAKEPYVDANRLGATGASYGGFSVYWLAGHHDKRFKAFMAHAGIFNMEQQYLETEEMWFANWDMGGAYWDKSNAVAQRTFANSPHLFVEKWDTPILVSHGELDYRILASQGMSAFNAAKLRGIPAELLIYPDECHWIAQPQNGVLFQRVFFNWFDKWLK